MHFYDVVSAIDNGWTGIWKKSNSRIEEGYNSECLFSFLHVRSDEVRLSWQNLVGQLATDMQCTIGKSSDKRKCLCVGYELVWGLLHIVCQKLMIEQ